MMNSLFILLDSAAAEAPKSLSLWEMAVNGGWIMIVLGVLLIGAVYIFIERYLTLSNALKGNDDSIFMDTIRQHVHEGNLDEARNLAKQTNSPLGRMISKGFSRLGRPLPDIQAAIEGEGKLEVANLEKRVSLVATVASLGPMIGFLGTVTGMITAFQDMQNAGTNISIQTLSGGISTAMVTTVGGLIVGIIALFAYNYLVARVDRIANEMESFIQDFTVNLEK